MNNRPANTSDTGRDYRTGGFYTYANASERDFDGGDSDHPCTAKLQCTASIAGVHYGSFLWSDGMVTIETLTDMVEAWRIFQDNGEAMDYIGYAHKI